MELDEDCALSSLLKSKIKCVNPKPAAWVLLAKYHRHVQNIHFKIIACYRLLSIVYYRFLLICKLFFLWLLFLSISDIIQYHSADEIYWYRISIDFRYRFISINYVWGTRRSQWLRQSDNAWKVCQMVPLATTSRQKPFSQCFPSCFKLLFSLEAKCKSLMWKWYFYSHSNN